MKVAASNTTAFLAGVVFGAAIFGADVAIDRGPDDAGTSLSTIVVISGLSVGGSCGSLRHAYSFFKVTLNSSPPTLKTALSASFSSVPSIT